MRESSPYIVFRHHYYNFPITMALGNILLAMEKGKFEMIKESLKTLEEFVVKMLSPEQLVKMKCSDQDALSVQQEVAILQSKFDHFIRASSEPLSKIESLLQAEEIDHEAVKAQAESFNKAWNDFCDFSSLKAKELA